MLGWGALSLCPCLGGESIIPAGRQKATSSSATCMVAGGGLYLHLLDSRLPQAPAVLLLKIKEWVRAYSLVVGRVAQTASIYLALPECCGRAPQPLPGPVELTILGTLALCWLLDPTGPDFRPALHQLVPFPVGWADTLCLGMWGLT